MPYLQPIWPPGWQYCKLSGKLRFYEFTRNDGGVLLSTEDDVVKERNSVIGGIANTGIAEKWCKWGAELKHLFAIVRKRSEDIETKKQGKKYVRQICFILILQKFNKCYYRLSEMESFSLTCSRMVVSYSSYPERSGLVYKRTAAKNSNR